MECESPPGHPSALVPSSCVLSEVRLCRGALLPASGGLGGSAACPAPRLDAWAICPNATGAKGGGQGPCVTFYLTEEQSGQAGQ